LGDDGWLLSWNVITPEAADAVATLQAKTANGANAKPNNFGIFISLVAGEFGKLRIADQAF